MENPEEILHSLEEFSKTRPKDIPRELEEYLCFVAKTGDPVYQWSAIKSLLREKMINVITEFYEQCPSVEIPPCPNVDLFNYDVMKNFILEKLDTFAAAPFTVQRICELLTTPRKEYNRIDKYMRALEKNVLVVSTTEPGGRRTAENGDGIVNGLESEHQPETSNSSNDINVEEMDETPSWSKVLQSETTYNEGENGQVHPLKISSEAACSSTQDSVITCRGGSSDEPYVSIEPVPANACARQEDVQQPDESDVSVTITAIPAGVQKRRSSVEPVVSSESEVSDSIATDSSDVNCDEPPTKEEPPAAKPEDPETSSSSSSSSSPSTSTSQEVKDADSSSNPEEEVDDELVDEKQTKSPEISASTDISEEAAPASTASTVDPALPSTSSEVIPQIESKTKHDCVEEIDTTTTSEIPVEEEEVEEEEERPKVEELASEEPAPSIPVDTTKCSIKSPPPPPVVTKSPERCVGDDSEITSSESSSTETEAEPAKPEETTNEVLPKIIEDISPESTEANSPDSAEDVKVSEVQESDSKVDVVVESSASPVSSESSSARDEYTPMEVDEEYIEKPGEAEVAEGEVVRAEATSDSQL